MKKTLAILSAIALILALLVSVVACDLGNNNSPTKESGKNNDNENDNNIEIKPSSNVKYIWGDGNEYEDEDTLYIDFEDEYWQELDELWDELYEKYGEDEFSENIYKENIFYLEIAKKLKERGFEANITIPEKWEGKKVEKVCFYFDVNIFHSLFIPHTVNVIDDVFFYLSTFESIVVSSDNEVYKSDKGCLIERESNKLIATTVDFEIPNYVKIIGDYAINCTAETIDLKIPESVEEFEEYSLYGLLICANGQCSYFG